MSRYGYLCGVPDEFCTGGKLVTDQGLAHKKYHGERREAFRCHVKYLLKMGFEQVGPREFKNPENGYIRVINKQSKFGGTLRLGKEGQRGMPMEIRKDTVARGIIY